MTMYNGEEYQGAILINSRAAKAIDITAGLMIKKARLKEGLTQRDLANKIGITFQQLQKYENGKNRITFGRIYDIARALKVDLPYFLGKKKQYSKNIAQVNDSIEELMVLFETMTKAEQKKVVDFARFLSKSNKENLDN